MRPEASMVSGGLISERFRRSSRTTQITSAWQLGYLHFQKAGGYCSSMHRSPFLSPFSSEISTIRGQKDLFAMNASVEFKADFPVLAYTTMIDNTSHDPTCVLPFADQGTPPQVGSIGARKGASTQKH